MTSEPSSSQRMETYALSCWSLASSVVTCRYARTARSSWAAVSVRASSTSASSESGSATRVRARTFE